MNFFKREATARNEIKISRVAEVLSELGFFVEIDHNDGEVILISDASHQTIGLALMQVALTK